MKHLSKIVGWFVFSFLLAKVAYADNCGSLSDCFYTIGSATIAAVGVTVMVIVGSLLDFFGWGENAQTPEPPPQPPVFSVNDPAADAIVLDPRVRAEMERAFAESNDNLLPDADVREQGGWIVRLPNGELDVVRWPQGESLSIQPSPKPDNAVAEFHTHPYGNDVELIHSPSATDSMAVQAGGIPGFIIDRQSIMRIDADRPMAFHDIVLR